MAPVQGFTVNHQKRPFKYIRNKKKQRKVIKFLSYMKRTRTERYNTVLI